MQRWCSDASSNSSMKPVCDEQLRNATSCQNGGQCYYYTTDGQNSDNNSQTTACCQCLADWTGSRCESPHIGRLITAEHEANVIRSSVLAGLSVAVLLAIVAIFAALVYVRYRRKCRLSADRPFKATADELYRRPFNGRSSIVESLSRINSIRRSVMIRAVQV
jgi:predicted metal-dependent HD superfamily phosphohydrolase